MTWHLILNDVLDYIGLQILNLWLYEKEYIYRHWNSYMYDGILVYSSDDSPLDLFSPLDL